MRIFIAIIVTTVLLVIYFWGSKFDTFNDTSTITCNAMGLIILYVYCIRFWWYKFGLNKKFKKYILNKFKIN